MRVPHTIPVNTFRVYAPSDQTMALQGERYTAIRSQQLLWDEMVPPSLVDICVQVLAANFEKHFGVMIYLMQKDFEYLLEILSVDLPLVITVPIVEDSIYWQRCCLSKWPNQPLDISKYGNSWKRLYIECYCQEYIEYQEPGYIDWEDVNKMMTICSPLVQRLDIRGLHAPRKWGPPAHPPDPCTRGKIDPDHINLNLVLQKLVNLSDFSIRFGLISCGMNYDPEYFRVSLADVTNLTDGLKQVKLLTRLRIHRCEIDDIRVNILLGGLVSCEMLEILEISHCKFGDIGTKSLGKLLIEHKRLKSLLIQNNRIGPEGTYGLAYALQHENCSPIQTLNLNYNIISDDGGLHLSTAIAKNRTLKELYLECVGMTSIGAIKLAEALLFSPGIWNIRLSNNKFDSDVNTHLIAAVEQNKHIRTLNLHNCGIDNTTKEAIQTFITRNRLYYRLKLNKLILTKIEFESEQII